MLIVGELINTSRKAINELVEKRDGEGIKKIAIDQLEAGANYIDVNCGTQVFNEIETMEWLVNTVQEAVQAPLCLDSPNPQAIEAGLALARYGQPMINSITGEKERFEQILPLVLKYQAKIMALCMDDHGMPNTGTERMKVARALHGRLTEAGVPEENIYFDPLVKPISVGNNAGIEVLDTVDLITKEFPQVHKICGLSNISFGLPNRAVLNRLFMVLTMGRGMDGYILNPLDKTMMGFVYGAQALLAQDAFCMGYLTAHRKGMYQE
ncbi:methyltetrahydrofolate cobalamin methyltransferase [Candidatus Formimonas warabiya]|uniref:Methyltetrahydrofolate--corrinoid methyltransferase n=1 Tax=Formimonas warabiya TaxID=1761012 RepID=A0A3G1L0H7_FORW1|nr:methyltetrahydrofolate cobalamin methyltransferase [Candidatus Formimonas warabiya]ATW28144.1 methyltetrahydrofolate--corrinoid methyltransferase [Candidatus Formimonas warabiya]